MSEKLTEEQKRAREAAKEHQEREGDYAPIDAETALRFMFGAVGQVPPPSSSEYKRAAAFLSELSVGSPFHGKHECYELAVEFEAPDAAVRRVSYSGRTSFGNALRASSQLVAEYASDPSVRVVIYEEDDSMEVLEVHEGQPTYGSREVVVWRSGALDPTWSPVPGRRSLSQGGRVASRFAGGWRRGKK